MSNSPHHFRDLIKKHLDSAEKNSEEEKIKVLTKVLEKYDEFSDYSDTLSLIRNRNDFESFMEEIQPELKRVMKERERTALVGHKFEELIFQLFENVANHFGLETHKGPVITWMGFSPKSLAEDEFKIKHFQMNADIAIGKRISFNINGEEKEFFIPLVFVTAKEMIEFYILRQVSKEAENAKTSNPNLLFLVIGAETQIGADKKELMNMWLKDVDGFYVFRNCKRGERKPFDVNVIRACEQQVYDHLESLRSGDVHLEKVNSGINQSNF